MSKTPKVLFTFMKRADVAQNRIVIPKFIIDNFGRDFYFKVYDDGTIKVIPIERLNKTDKEE